jgi:hypothetical protein
MTASRTLLAASLLGAGFLGGIACPLVGEPQAVPPAASRPRPVADRAVTSTQRHQPLQRTSPPITSLAVRLLHLNDGARAAASCWDEHGHIVTNSTCRRRSR